MTDKPETTKSKKNSSPILIIIIFLLIGATGFLFFQLQNLKTELANCEENTVGIQQEKKEVVNELNEMLVQVDTLSLKNSEMSEELVAKREEIKKLIKQAKNQNWTIHKLKKETATLREIMKGYLHTMDSLNTANLELQAENKEVKKELQNQKSKYSDLEKVRENLANKVEIGSRLQAKSVDALAYKVKDSGIQRETDRASKADKIKCCILLAANKITKPGKKTVYLRIISPSGTALNDNEDNRFEFNGVRGYYSAVQEIDYQNKEQELCLEHRITQTLPEGDYKITAYIDGEEIGDFTLTLR